MNRRIIDQDIHDRTNQHDMAKGISKGWKVLQMIVILEGCKTA